MIAINLFRSFVTYAFDERNFFSISMSITAYLRPVEADFASLLLHFYYVVVIILMQTRVSHETILSNKVSSSQHLTVRCILAWKTAEQHSPLNSPLHAEQPLNFLYVTGAVRFLQRCMIPSSYRSPPNSPLYPIIAFFFFACFMLIATERAY